MFEFILHGTGTSSSLPDIACLTDPNTACPTCPTTLRPEGVQNIRRNTGAILRKRLKGLIGQDGLIEDDRDVVVVIDIGKTFRDAAREWFPKYGLRKIDAVLLTHAHADATNGLDDLRSWTLGAVIQAYIDIYLSIETFNEIKRAFPYLISPEFATGGGDVPDFRWHFIKENTPFHLEAGGFWITPVAVDHGRKFPMASQQLPFTPNFAPSPVPPLSDLSSPSSPRHPSIKGLAPPPLPALTPTTPLKCFGFIINMSLLYMSDVSNIPEEE